MCLMMLGFGRSFLSFFFLFLAYNMADFAQDCCISIVFTFNVVATKKYIISDFPRILSHYKQRSPGVFPRIA